MMKKLAIFILLLATTLAQQYPLEYDTEADTYVDGDHPNTNYGGLNYLLVDRDADRRAVLKFHLDQPQTLFSVHGSQVQPDVDIDCNHWNITVAVYLNVFLQSVTNCYNGCELKLYTTPVNFTEDTATWNCPNDINLQNHRPNCPLGRWNGGFIRGPTEVSSTTVYNSNNVTVQFDITRFAHKLNTTTGYDVTFVITVTGDGSVKIASSESSSGPTISVVNPTFQVNDTGNRHFSVVNGLNMSYVIHGEQFPASNGVVFVFPPKPGYSYGMRRSTAIVAQNTSKRVYVFDYVGSGYSEKPTDLNVFNYEFGNQSAYIAALISTLDIVSSSNPAIIWCQEIGCMMGLNLARQYPTYVSKIILNVASYISTCPAKFSVSATNQLPGPNFTGGFGVCQNETLVPFTFWPVWELCVYASVQCACDAFVQGPQGFLNPDAVATKYTAHPLPPPVVENYLAPYPNASQDVTCTRYRGEVEFPRHAPAPVAGEPSDSAFILDAINEYMRTSNVTKLFYYADYQPMQFIPGLELPPQTSSVQISRINQVYTNAQSVCLGIGSGHLLQEDLGDNMGYCLSNNILYNTPC